MKKAVIIFLLLSVHRYLSAQSVGIGTAAPNSSAQLDVSSTTKGMLVPRMTTAQRNAIATPANGLLVFDITTNSFWFHNGTAWADLTASDSSKWKVSGSNIYSNNAGNVGIGTSTTPSKLTVNGDALVFGALGIGLILPDFSNYTLDVNGHVQFRQDLVVNNDTWLNGGVNVSGPANLYGNVYTGTHVNVAGNLTVNNGKGVIRNTAGVTQLKYYARQASFNAVLAGFALSPEGSFSIASGGFLSSPKVMVGDIVSTGGTVGELYRVQLVVYGCTATSCKMRLINTSPNPVDYSITWNIICIGD